MSPRAYRRLTRILFFFLFLVFLLLYLLLANHRSAGPAGGGWGNRTRDMGTIALSEIRSGGFILDELPIPAATSQSAEDFTENVISCTATLHNEGGETIKVTANVYGTDQNTGAEVNPGLNCGVYHYAGEVDPLAPNYQDFLSGAAATFNHMERYTTPQYPMKFMLKPNETRRLVLFFWTDEIAVPLLTDSVRSTYSVTVKLTARTP